MAIELTSFEVSEFFQERGAKWECPICNHAGWVTVGPTFGHHLPVVVISVTIRLDRAIMEEYASVDIGESLSEETKREFLSSNDNNAFKFIGFPALLFACKNCGFIRTHSAHLIKNKGIDDNGTEE